MSDDRRIEAEHSRGDPLASLLRMAGRRHTASPEAEARARASARSEWIALLGARRRSRRAAVLAAAAVATVAAVGFLARRRTAPPSLGSVALCEGTVFQIRGSDRVAVFPGALLRPGDVLQTGPGGLAAIAFGDGASLRLAPAATVTLESPTRVGLAAGTVYFDSGTARTRRARFELRTPVGDVRDIGTQFEARLDSGRLRVRVREGRVRVDRAGRMSTAPGGTELVLGPGDLVSRRSIPIRGAEWNWVLRAAPPFPIEGRSLEEFLRWASRETARPVRFAPPELEQRAPSIVLHGSIRNLTPDSAVDAVLPTCGLSAQRRGEEIVVRADAAAGPE
jgi:ferric-dicitrate binding protein FerR (iron transport regulator)